MKVVQINAVCGSGSTGKICQDISSLLTASDIENYVIYSFGKHKFEYGIQCASRKYIKLQALKSRIFGNYGFNSKNSTEKMISELERIKPDILQLHNIHDHNCNLELLFEYIKKNNIKTFWTFHDCWAMTAYCAYFDRYKCEKWKHQCSDCPAAKHYSWFFDRSKFLYQQKNKLFKDIDLTIITPSQWLADITMKSFLRHYPLRVINNGIDLNVFKPTPGDFRTKYALDTKFIILGVAFFWETRKGLDVFIELSKRLDSKQFAIVLVGTDSNVEKQLPDSIIPIRKTQNQTELAEIYTASDLFVNPSREDNLPTVNIEALACGTPVLTFNTGGSPELIDETCGSVVECNDVDSLEQEILRISAEKPYSQNACTEHASMFDKYEKFKEYVVLYKEVGYDRTSEC